MQAVLKCDVCAVEAGAFETYDAWSDAASALRWEIGEEVVICAGCLGRARVPQQADRRASRPTHGAGVRP
jgi:hypothetical protein